MFVNLTSALYIFYFTTDFTFTINQKNKEKRKQASGTFGTMIPRALFDEINAFLEENRITKVQLVKEGYEALKSKKENGTLNKE